MARSQWPFSVAEGADTPHKEYTDIKEYPTQKSKIYIDSYFGIHSTPDPVLYCVTAVARKRSEAQVVPDVCDMVHGCMAYTAHAETAAVW